MTPTAAEVLDAAMALSRADRAAVTQGLLATLARSDVSDEARPTALREAVGRGVGNLLHEAMDARLTYPITGADGWGRYATSVAAGRPRLGRSVDSSRPIA